ncbi:MAG: P-loop NTPase [Desulfobulbaceae bacterium]|nr:P-loop NTPase [Desulfobulbaceae bacterium]
MKEILVLSGKGGTGKTSITGSLAYLMRNTVLVDCDVDAADLHLILSPEVREKNEFWSGVEAVIDQSLCTGCGTCSELCQFQAITLEEKAQIRPFSCEGCGVCAEFCPEDAIRLKEKNCGNWFLSDTQFGPMVHARLGIGEENSGKLVSLVKKQARHVAEKRKADWILVDGPPGIGCPVIASMSGAGFSLLVTEPTKSGLHDLMRVVQLSRHFKIPSGVCINKWDLHPDFCKEIEQACSEENIPVLGKVPFDKKAVESIIHGKPLVQFAPDSAGATAIIELWEKIEKIEITSSEF